MRRAWKSKIWYNDPISLHTNTPMLKRLLSCVLVLGCVVAPVPVSAEATAIPQEIDYVLTAYYSPLPGQCCYVKGGIVADKILNGNGTHGADGTPVYVGMLAAPPTYAFGTRISLPGLGVLEVHDRGGAIQVIEGGAIHRLDVWAGYGEEGLARALSFGVKRIRGTMYPPSGTQPAEDFTLDRIPLDFDRLRPYNVVQHGLVDLEPKAGDTSLSVAYLQDHLHTLGYLEQSPTRFFGPETRVALERFQTDRGIAVQSESLDAETAASLMAAVRLLGRDMGVPLVNEQSSRRDIASVQRLLRSMKYYRGRTDGLYGDTLKRAIMAFQKEKLLIGDETSPGAGTIGPVTQAMLADTVRSKRSKTIARGIVLLKRVRDTLAEREALVAVTLSEGYSGENVKVVQRLLARLGYFPADKINGQFGELTKQSVAAYQVENGVLASGAQKGAGVIGPITLKSLQKAQIQDAYTVVRGYGWDAL